MLTIVLFISYNSAISLSNLSLKTAPCTLLQHVQSLTEIAVDRLAIEIL